MFKYLSFLKHVFDNSPENGEAPGKEFVLSKVHVKGTQIHYATIGRGKPIVLIHGWTNNWEGWIQVAQILRHKHKVYLIDLPGFGDSDGLDVYSIPNEAKYVADFIEMLHLSPVAIVGLSMGSLVAACCVRDYPEICKKVVLIGPIFKTGKRSRITQWLLQQAFWAIDQSERAETIVKQIIETRLSAYMLSKTINMYEFNHFLVDAYGMMGRKKVTKEAFIQMGISMTQTKLEKLLETVKMPVLIMCGSHDKITRTKQARKALKDVPGNFSYKSILFAGHVASLEKPRQVGRAILNFLKKS